MYAYVTNLALLLAFLIPSTQDCIAMRGELLAYILKVRKDAIGQCFGDVSNAVIAHLLNIRQAVELLLKERPEMLRTFYAIRPTFAYGEGVSIVLGLDNTARDNNSACSCNSNVGYLENGKDQWMTYPRAQMVLSNMPYLRCDAMQFKTMNTAKRLQEAR